jgi:hypothetical protein
VIRDFPKLKINLAHFGGMEQHYATEKRLRKKFGDKYYDSCVKTWVNKIAELASSKPNVYTDISCYTFDSLREAPLEIPDVQMSRVFANCTTTQKRFLQDNYHLDQPNGFWYLNLGVGDADNYQIMNILETNKGYPKQQEFKNLAASLKTLITDKKLKEKILMGSDWYMSELSGIKGTGPYQGRMFELLRFITKETNDEYDMWHQFAVVNTLCFLGFLQTDDSRKPKTEDFNGKKVCIWDRERVKKYLSVLEKIQADENIIRFKVINDKDVNKFKDKIELRFEQLMHSKIFDSSEIKDSENKLLITSIVG